MSPRSVGTAVPDVVAGALPVLETFLSHDTTSSRSNLELLGAVMDRCRELGIEAELLPSPDGSKANLLATVPASDGRRSGGVMLLGHSDTVPVEGQAWSRDPFTPWIEGGRLHGRGAADMKSFCACVVAALPAFVARPLGQPVHVVLTYDEELGCLGARRLTEVLADRGLRPDLCVVGEPTSMQLIRAHKSGTVTRIRFHGAPAHSSAPGEGCNAITYAARAVAFLGDLAAEYRTTRGRDESFTVPYSTINVGTIRGGLAVNIVAEHCELEWETRALEPAHRDDVVRRVEEHLRGLEAEMRREHPLARIESEVLADFPGLGATGQAQDLLDAMGLTDEALSVSYGTEAGLLGAMGVPTVVCGPGSIDQAHRPDEYVELTQVAACMESLLALAGHLALDGRADTCT